MAHKHLSIVRQRAKDTSYFSVPACLLAGLAAAGRHSVNCGAIDLFGAVTAAVLDISAFKKAANSRSLHIFHGITLDRDLLGAAIPAVFEGIPVRLHWKAVAELLVVPTTLALARSKFPSVAGINLKQQSRYRKGPTARVDVHNLCLVEREPPAGKTPLDGDPCLFGGEGEPEFKLGIYRLESWRYFSSAAARHDNPVKWKNQGKVVSVQEHCELLAKRVAMEYEKRRTIQPEGAHSPDPMTAGDANVDGTRTAEATKASTAKSVVPTPGPELDVLVPYYSFLVDLVSKLNPSAPSSTVLVLLTAVLAEVVVNAGGNAALVCTSPLWKTTRACQVTRLFDREEDEHARSALLAVYDESQAACRELELGKMARSPM